MKHKKPYQSKWNSREFSFKEFYPKESWQIFQRWLFLAAVVLGCYGISPIKFRNYDAAEGFCIIGMLCIIGLYMLIAVTGKAYWIPAITYEEAAAAGMKACRKYGMKQVLIYSAALILYLIYCYENGKSLVSSTTYHAIAGAAILGAAARISGKMKLSQANHAKTI